MSFITKAPNLSPLARSLFTTQTSIRTFQTSFKRTIAAALGPQTNQLSNRVSFRLPSSPESVRFSSTSAENDSPSTDKKPTFTTTQKVFAAGALLSTLAYYTSQKLDQAEQEREIKCLVQRADEIIDKLVEEMPSGLLYYKAREEITGFLGRQWILDDLDATRRYAQGYIDFESSVQTANIGRPKSQEITLYRAYQAFKRAHNQIDRFTEGGSIVFSDPDLTMIPGFIEYRAHLIRHIEITSPISGLPAKFVSLKKLESLKIQSRCLYQFPDVITKLENLKQLNLSHNKIRLIPDCITGLKNLEIFYISDNSLLILPEAIGDLPRLSSLNLSNNSLETLPASMNRLQELTYLDLAANHFYHFPPQLFGLRKLDLLSLSHNKISRIPNDIETLPNLTALICAFNKIESVSVRISECQKLTHLDLRGNALRSIESAIVNLPNLNCLVLDKNQLTQIPVDLFFHKTLSRLAVGNNPLKCVILPSFIQSFLEKRTAFLSLPISLETEMKKDIECLSEDQRSRISFDKEN